MATIELTIPAGKLNRVIKALCVTGGFEEQNAANAKQALINIIKHKVWQVETQEAEATAAAGVTPDDGLAS